MPLKGKVHAAVGDDVIATFTEGRDNGGDSGECL